MQAEPDATQLREELPEQCEDVSAESRALAAIAHELKNPIQTLGNLLYLAARETMTQSARDYLSLAQQELTVLRTIVANTLGAVRDHSSEAEISLAEIFDGILRSHSEKISYKKVVIDKRVDFADLIRTSPVEVRMIVDNIFRNALEAVPMCGRIVIHVTRGRAWTKAAGSGFRIVIADNGPGIRIEHEKRIFEPFFTTKTEKGTGIGLWVVQRTVRKYGGSVHFRTSLQPGRTGTVFSMFLPTAERSERSSAQLNAKSETAAQGSS